MLQQRLDICSIACGEILRGDRGVNRTFLMGWTSRTATQSLGLRQILGRPAEQGKLV